jgi:CheY-like chemotaxis protein
MKILLIEDDLYKKDQLEEFLKDSFINLSIDTAMSVNSAKKSLQTDVYDLLILDMSLPTFDISAEEAGGRPQNYGGADILRYLRRKKIMTKSIVVTQYEEFIDNSLKRELMEKYEENFAGMVYFDINKNWVSALHEAIDKIDTNEI